MDFCSELIVCNEQLQDVIGAGDHLRGVGNNFHLAMGRDVHLRLDGLRQEAVMNMVALEISRVLYDASVVVIISLEPPLPTTSDA